MHHGYKANTSWIHAKREWMRSIFNMDTQQIQKRKRHEYAMEIKWIVNEDITHTWWTQYEYIINIPRLHTGHITKP